MKCIKLSLGLKLTLKADSVTVCTVVAGCRAQCVASHVQREDLDQTVLRNVSVTTTASVSHPLDSVSAALDTQENGKRSCLLLLEGNQQHKKMWSVCFVRDVIL